MTVRVAALALLFGSVAGGTAAAQDQDFSSVEIKTETLAPGVYMLTGDGGNIGLSVGEDTAFVIDDQYAPLTDKILAAIKKVTDKPVRFVINTHWHDDHTGGNENLGKAGAVIIAHDNVRKRMSVEQFNRDLNRKSPPSPKSALPVVTFSESATLHLNGDTVHLVHVPPAHTDGDSIVHFSAANVIHMGDLFVNGSYPFVDRGSGGRIEGIIAAAEKVLSMANETTKIIPGHGPLGSKKDLEVFRDVLASITDRVSALIRDGKSLSEVQAAQPTKEHDAKWGTGFQKPDQFLAIVYASLKGSD